MDTIPATYWAVVWGMGWTIEGYPMPFFGRARKNRLTAYRFGPMLILKIKLG